MSCRTRETHKLKNKKIVVTLSLLTMKFIVQRMRLHWIVTLSIRFHWMVTYQME